MASSITQDCPPGKLHEPCTCNYGHIYCAVKDDIDLVKVFQTLEKNLTKEEKHFKEINLSNSFITELKENTFSDITFDEIRIQRCYNLKTIHKNAFTTTDQVTIRLYIYDNYLLFFEAVNKFTKIISCTLSYNNITEIPSYAFKNRQDQLKTIAIYDESIKRIGENIFSNLKNLDAINLIQTSIDFISENTFEFNEESNRTLFVFLSGNKFLNSSGLSEHSLTKFKRPTTIYFQQYKNNTNFSYFDENYLGTECYRINFF